MKIYIAPSDYEKEMDSVMKVNVVGLRDGG